MAQGYTGSHNVDFTRFLLLAGRTGTTNDPTINSAGTAKGTISGSAQSGGTLVLQGSTNATATQAVAIASNVTTIGANTLNAITINPSLTFDSAASTFNGYTIPASLTWLFTTNAAGPHQPFMFAPVISNSPSGTGRTAGTWFPFVDNATYANVGAATLTVTEIDSFISNPILSVSGGGAVTCTTRKGLSVVGGIGGTVTTEIGVDIGSLTGTTAAISLRSTGAAVEMRHAGPARFGATGAVTSGTTLDLQGGFTGKVTNGGDTTYTILTSDYIIIAPITTARTYNLPTIASAGVGKVYILIHTGATTAVLTVARASADTINNAATTYAPTGTVYRLYYIVAVTTTNWAIVSTIP